MVKRFYSVLVIFGILMALCGCMSIGYELPQANNQIVSIQIVDTADHGERVPKSIDELDITILKSLESEEQEAFLDEFSNVEYCHVWNDATYSVAGKGILITYRDGARLIIGICMSFYDDGTQIQKIFRSMSNEYLTFLQSWLEEK